jgi:hypothetical protein
MRIVESPASITARGGSDVATLACAIMGFLNKIRGQDHGGQALTKGLLRYYKIVTPDVPYALRVVNDRPPRVIRQRHN